jgi:protein involved in polysaccharide export with SLBB domain
MDYHFDLAYDTNSVASGPFGGILQWGLISIATVNGQTVIAPAEPTNFNPNDTIEFYIYDVTTRADPSSTETTGVTIQGQTLNGQSVNWITTGAADDQSGLPANPFSNLATLQAANVVFLGLGKSTVFGDGPTSNGYPQWVVVQNGTTSNSPLSANVQTGGSFTLTFQITVNGTGNFPFGPTTYGVDPDMIVNS